MDESNSKEINLLQLISIGVDWLKKIFGQLIDFIGFLLKLCFKRKISLLVVIFISIAVGQYLSRKSARIYQAEALALIYGSDAQTVREISRQLENSLQSNSLISLGTKLHLPDSVAKNIIGIKSFYLIDYMRDSVADKIDYNNSHSLSDTMNVRMTDRIYIQLKTKNIGQVPQVEKALLSYFNNNEMLLSKLQARRNEFQQQIIVCDAELLRIDSLAKVTYFKDNVQQLKFDNNKLLLGEQHKQLFFNELLALQGLKSKAQIRLNEFKNPVELPSNLVVSPVAINGRIKYGLYSILIGAVIGLFFILFLEYIKPIFTFLKSE